jgi:hypothetical protein
MEAPDGEIWMQKEDGQRRQLTATFAALLELESEGLVTAVAEGRGNSVRWRVTSEGRDIASSLAPATGLSVF